MLNNWFIGEAGKQFAILFSDRSVEGGSISPDAILVGGFVDRQSAEAFLCSILTEVLVNQNAMESGAEQTAQMTMAQVFAKIKKREEEEKGDD